MTVPDESICDPPDYTNSTSDMIRQELASHRNLSSNQFRVLESALSLVGRFASMSHHAESTQYEKDDEDEVMSPMELPTEIFYNLLGGTLRFLHFSFFLSFIFFRAL